MINTLNFGKYIYSVLKNITDNRVFPLVADEGTKFPFIVYRRVNLTNLENKDGYVEDNVTMEITVVADKYTKSVEIINKVREILEIQNTSFEDMDISDASITMATEEYNNSAYIQKIQISFKINN